MSATLTQEEFLVLLDDGEHTIALQPGDHDRQRLDPEAMLSGGGEARVVFRDCLGVYTHFTIDEQPYSWIGGEPLTFAVPGNLTVTFPRFEPL